MHPGEESLYAGRDARELRSGTGQVKGALQLLMDRHMQTRFARVHERVLLLRSVELLTAITSDLPMKPGRTQKK